MKGLNVLLVGFFILTQSVWAGVTLNSAARDMENEIAGGKGRPKDIRVKVIKGRFFLEGAVDKLAERKTAAEICLSYAAHHIKLQSTGFKSLDDLCVNLVKIRAGQPSDPSPILRIEYRVIYISNTKISAGNLLADNFYNATEFPKDARLIKSVAVNLADGEDGLLDGRMPASSGIPPAPASYLDQQPAVTAISSEKFLVNSEDSSKGLYSFETTTRAISISGSDKINVDADVHIANATTQMDRRIKTKLVIPNGTTAGLGSWISLEEKNSKTPGLLILVRVDKLRTINEAVSP